MVTLGETEEVLNYLGPSDSASLASGNGFNICGPLTYEMKFNDNFGNGPSDDEKIMEL